MEKLLEAIAPLQTKDWKRPQQGRGGGRGRGSKRGGGHGRRATTSSTMKSATSSLMEDDPDILPVAFMLTKCATTATGQRDVGGDDGVSASQPTADNGGVQELEQICNYCSPDL